MSRYRCSFMKRVFYFILCFLLCFQMSAQTESMMEVCNELNRHQDWNEQDVIDYILAHRDSFDMENSIDYFWYNSVLGGRYYSLGKWQDALSYLRNIVLLLDIYGDEMNFSSNPRLLLFYYCEALCDFNVGASKEQVLTKLQRLKVLFEKNGLSETRDFQDLIHEIEVIENDAVPSLSAACVYMISEKYEDAIPLLEQFIKKSSQSQQMEYFETSCKCLSRNR